MLIDIHTHIDDGMYNEEYFRVINSVDNDDFENILNLSKKDKKAIPCFGVHPWYADTLNKEMLEKYISENENSYLGETGLDYGQKAKLGQEDAFAFHLYLSKKYNRPLMIHCYNASNEMYNMIKDEISVPFLIHRYSDDVNMTNKFVDLGAYFSFAYNSPEKMIKAVPIDRILSETDGKMYEVTKSVNSIAEVLGKTPLEMKEQIWENAKKLLTKSNFNG